ncbi:MAG: PAS domain S-box protein [Gammaproteobacteria bacterium]|nr:PAS domain S-box protein [Gammaproteobacteria bacterium]
MREISASQFRKRYLYAFSIATIAVPAIGAIVEVFLGAYSFEEIVQAVASYTVFYILAVLVFGIYLQHKFLLHYSGALEDSLARGNTKETQQIAHKLSRMIIFSLIYILLYSQGGPFSVNYYIHTETLRILTTEDEILTYLDTLPTVLIILFPIYFYLNDLLGSYLGPKGVVFNAIPIRTKIMVLGIVTPLLIDMMLILYFYDRTGYFNQETIYLWFALIAIATAGAYLVSRSFFASIKPLQGPLLSDNLDKLTSMKITPYSLDEIGFLVNGWQKLLKQLRQNQISLQDERNFTNAILNNANALVVVLDRYGHFVEFNKVCENITGYRREEMIGTPVWDRVIPDDEKQTVMMVFEDLVTSTIHNTHTNYWQTREGSRRLISWSNSTLNDAHGNVTNIIAIGVDVTDQQQMEEELRTNQDTLYRAQAIAHIGHWDWNILSNDLQWSDEVFRIFGLTPQQFAATYPAFLECIHPDDRDAVTSSVTAAVEDASKPYNIEHRVVRPDGSIRIVNERGEIYRDKSGKPMRMVGTVHDITERKEAEDALRNSEQMYREVFEASEDATFIMNDQGIIDVNGAALQMFVAEHRDRLCNLKPWRLSPDHQPNGESSEELGQQMVQLAYKNHFHRFEWLHQRLDGTTFPAEVTLTTTQVGEQPLIHASIRDITKRKQSEEEIQRLNEDLEKRVQERTNQLEASLEDLKRAQKHLVDTEKMAALGGLVAGVAHEINTPIGIGVTAASHLQMQLDEYSELYDKNELKRSDFEDLLTAATESTGILMNNLNRAAEMIRSFKQVAVDQSSESPRRFEICSYLHEVIRSLSPRLKQGEYHIEVDCPKTLEIETYPGAISQIITNLIINSIIHGFEESGHGDIYIAISRTEQDITIRYRDNGVGIEQENLRKIFEPFYTTKRGSGGSGLGLHILFNIVSQTLGGTIEVESSKGEGMQILICFPEHGVSS